MNIGITNSINKNYPKLSFGAHNYINTPDNNTQKQPEESDNKVAKTVLSMGMLGILDKCVQLASNFFANLLMQGKEFAPEDKVIKAAETMKNKNGLKAEIHFIDESSKGGLIGRFPELKNSLDVVAKGQNAFYIDKYNFAVAPKSKPSLILHELGHATNFEKGKVMKMLQKLRPFSAIAPTALVFLDSLIPEKEDGKKNVIEKHAGKIAFATMLPTIIEEGVASLRGINAAKEVAGKADLKALKKNYFFAWMTYVLAGVAIGIVSKYMVLQNNLNRSNKDKQKNKLQYRV